MNLRRLITAISRPKNSSIKLHNDTTPVRPRVPYDVTGVASKPGNGPGTRR